MRIATGYGELGRVLAGLAPLATGIFFVIIGAVPAGFPEFSSITPLFGLCVIYFWIMVSPSVMPPAAVFVIGILQDGLSGDLIGLWTLTFLIVQFLTVSQRRVLLTNVFGHGWFGFAVTALTAGAIAWLVACIFYGTLISPVGVFVQALLTISIYPVIAWILIRCWRLLPASS